MQCATPLEVARSGQAPQVQARTGQAFELDAAELFGVTAGNEERFHWTQMFMEQDWLEYVSNHALELLNPDSSTVSILAEVPGKYRLRLTAEALSGRSESHEVDVLVVQDAQSVLAAKGVEFPDIFGRLGGPEFDINPENQECLAAVLDHALDGPFRVGANLVGIVPAVFYEQITPTPQFAPWANDLSLTDDAYYAALVGATKARGFKVMHTEQVSPGFYTGPEEWDLLPELTDTDPQWWAAFFDEWERWIVPRAARAEAGNVDILHVLLWTDWTFRPDVYPDYDQRWREIIAAIREVYSGEIAVSLSNHANDSFTFLDAVDIVIVMSFSGFQLGLEADGRRLIADRNAPKLGELIEAYRQTFALSRDFLAGKATVYYALGAVSADGQAGSEDPEVIVTLTPDFREQVLYYEALFAALDEEPWVDGIILQRMDWFDEYRRPPEEIYWDETLSGSPRSKPAEEVLRLWFGVR